MDLNEICLVKSEVNTLTWDNWIYVREAEPLLANDGHVLFRPTASAIY
jgi:hypothetical protein